MRCGVARPAGCDRPATAASTGAGAPRRAPSGAQARAPGHHPSLSGTPLGRQGAGEPDEEPGAAGEPSGGREHREPVLRRPLPGAEVVRTEEGAVGAGARDGEPTRAANAGREVETRRRQSALPSTTRCDRSRSRVSAVAGDDGISAFNAPRPARIPPARMARKLRPPTTASAVGAAAAYLVAPDEDATQGSWQGPSTAPSRHLLAAVASVPRRQRTSRSRRSTTLRHTSSVATPMWISSICPVSIMLTTRSDVPGMPGNGHQ